MTDQEQETRPRPTLNREFLVNRQGKDFVLFSGLLDLAHQMGLASIKTHLVQIPGKANDQVAIVHATVTMLDATEFSGLGDASPENTSRMIAPHAIRLAETRSVARALRLATNIGVTALEELGGDDSREEDAPRSRSNRDEGRRYESRDNQRQRAAPRQESRGDGGPASPKQIDTINRMARRLRKRVDTDDMSRNEASELITQMIGELDEQGSDSEDRGDRRRSDQEDEAPPRERARQTMRQAELSVGLRKEQEEAGDGIDWDELVSAKMNGQLQDVDRRTVWASYQQRYDEAKKRGLFGDDVPERMRAGDDLKKMIAKVAAIGSLLKADRARREAQEGKQPSGVVSGHDGPEQEGEEEEE